MIKKLLAFLLILAMVFSLSACEKKYDVYTKVADNLYEVTCDEYDYDYMLRDGYGNMDFFGGCSAIKEGNYIGRNFDFVAGDFSEVVVKTTPKKGRYASVGVVGGLFWLSQDFMESGLNEDTKKIMPLMVLDGINEKGLAVAINCVNAADVSGLTAHTNIGKPEVAQLCVVRYLLDKAATADEAIEILRNIDIVNNRDLMGLISYGFEVHFLIADKDKSYVVELSNAKPDGEKLIIIEDESLITNFYVHLADVEKDIYPDYAMGVERYKKLLANRESVTSVDTMKQLMQSVKYTNSNRTDGEYDPGVNCDNPFTCISDHSVYGGNMIIYKNCREHIPEVLEIMKHDENAIAEILNDPKMINPDNLWVTSHSCVYDLENKTMSIAVFERFNSYYDYSAK